MQSLHREAGKNQSVPILPITGITLSESWRSAFGKLSAACLSDARAVILLGERGVGKSSLLEAWKDVSSSTFHVVTLKDATGEPDQVVADLANLLDVDTADLGRGAILNAVSKTIEDHRESGKETVVIVEDADNIPANTIELLMVLSRFRGSSQPLLRYIFTGTKALRKTMRLDGTTARRQNYVVVELERFNREQTKAFAIANLARNSNITISDDAASYLHESTSGKPANILSVLDKVQNGRMAEGETEITRQHIQSLVKAPTPDSTLPASSGAVAELAITEPKETLIPEEEPATANGQDSAPSEVAASAGNGNGELPDSIRSVNDPRPLLRWAFGLEEHSETDALAKQAQQAAESRSSGAGTNPGNAVPVDLNEALAKVTERERASRNGTSEAVAPKPKSAPPSPLPEAVEQAPVIPKADNVKPLRADPTLRASKNAAALDEMIKGESFSFEDRKPAQKTPVRNPYELKEMLADEPVQRPGKSKKILLAAGFAVLGLGAFGMLWTALDPRKFANPELGIPSGQTASVAAKQAEESLAQAASVPELGDAIAVMKAPSLSTTDVSSLDTVALFSERMPRLVPSAYLPPSSTETSRENFGLKQTIVADMAESERLELASEEQRMMERLETLSAELEEKETTLDGLERAISAIAYQTRESSEVLDNRSAEIEVVTSRLAFMARDRALAERRLEEVTRDAVSTEENLIRMRDELIAAESKIAQNEALLNESSTTNANLGDALEKRTQEFEALNQRFVETETLLETRRAELANVLAEREAAESELSTLNAQLEQARTSQAEVQSDLASLIDERDGQLKASNAVSGELETADQKLIKAQNALAAATKALEERTTAYAQLEAKSAEAQSKLDDLSVQLSKRENLIVSSNEELETLQRQRIALEGELSKMAEQISSANDEIAQLASVEQSTSAEFKDLEAKRQALNEELETGTAALNKISEELTKKEREVLALSEELELGNSSIAKQQSELADLETQTAAVVAAQKAASETVAVEQEQVAQATSALADLKKRQEELSASIVENEQRAVAVKDELQRIENTKSRAETEIASTTARLREFRAKEGEYERTLASFNNQITARETRLMELERRISASNKQLEIAAKKRQELNNELASISTEGTSVLMERKDELSRIEAELEKKRMALAAVAQELDKKALMLDERVVVGSDSNLALSSLPAPATRASNRAPSVPSGEPAVAAETGPGVSVSARDAEIVVSALADAPGLGRVTSEKKAELQAALVRGDCVTDALKATFGRVNPHTLVALLENMEMCGS